MTEIVLHGCAPTPLASYLKALGVLRLLAEQEDPEAKGCWRDDGFVVISRLDAASLESFFVQRYQPTPIVAPWGGRSGFYPESSDSAARAALDRITQSDLPRLHAFREAIATVRNLLVRLGFSHKPDTDDAKLALLRACRAELPDEMLPWLDACYVLTDDYRAFPPLLGTGGNEGSGSYVSAFAQLVVSCVIDRTHDGALAPALFGIARPDTGSNQVPGQFAPLAAGGPNATSGFAGGTTLNAWDFMLCLEGTLLFAAAATKRLETAGPGALAFPFTVRAVGAGAGGVAMADEPAARAETWFPIWEQPASVRELRAILSEGRVQVSGRTASNALDFARAVSSLGIQRGITAFQRYGYLQRFGRNVIAVPIDRVPVRENRLSLLIADLEKEGDWLARFRQYARRAEAPDRLRRTAARLENALFAMTRSNEPWIVQEALARLGDVLAYLATSKPARDAIGTVPTLRSDWVSEADDGSHEFIIGAALAGLHGERSTNAPNAPVFGMIQHFAPVNDERDWTEGANRNYTWGTRALSSNLTAVVLRRIQQTEGLSLDTPWASFATAPIAAIAALLNDTVDERRLSDLLRGLVLARIPNHLVRGQMPHVAVPPAYALLKLYFVPRKHLDALGRAIDAESRPLEPPPQREALTVARLLAANRVADAVHIAVRRMRANGQPMLAAFEDTAQPRDGGRLLAALAVPINKQDLIGVLGHIMKPAESQMTPITDPEE